MYYYHKLNHKNIKFVSNSYPSCFHSNTNMAVNAYVNTDGFSKFSFNNFKFCTLQIIKSLSLICIIHKYQYQIDLNYY
jgi:hypothetical protein